MPLQIEDPDTIYAFLWFYQEDVATLVLSIDKDRIILLYELRVKLNAVLVVIFTFKSR